jgi:hypothetical protein
MLQVRTGKSRPDVRSDAGQGLVEVLIALTFLAIAVAAILALATAGAVSLQRTGRVGTATTLAEKQLEIYRAISYANVRLHVPLPNSGTYFSAHSSDPSIPAATPCTTGVFSNCEVVEGANSELSCSSTPPECQPEQTVLGPDHRTYIVQTYITYVTPVSGATTGRQTKVVLVVVRDSKLPGNPILARTGSSFDQSNGATG